MVKDWKGPAHGGPGQPVPLILLAMLDLGQGPGFRIQAKKSTGSRCGNYQLPSSQSFLQTRLATKARSKAKLAQRDGGEKLSREQFAMMAQPNNVASSLCWVGSGGRLVSDSLVQKSAFKRLTAGSLELEKLEKGMMLR